MDTGIAAAGESAQGGGEGFAAEGGDGEVGAVGALDGGDAAEVLQFGDDGERFGAGEAEAGGDFAGGEVGPAGTTGFEEERENGASARVVGSRSSWEVIHRPGGKGAGKAAKKSGAPGSGTTGSD